MRPSLQLGRRFVHIERRIAELGYTLPAPAVPKGNFVNFKRVGSNLVYLSGHLPQIPTPGSGFMLGKVEVEVSVEEAKTAALYCALNMCATLKLHLGDLDRVKSVVKLLGFVNCKDSFTQQPAVVNGCSDAIVAIFGEKGHHTRSAVGTNSLPLGVPVEVEAIFEIEQ